MVVSENKGPAEQREQVANHFRVRQKFGPTATLPRYEKNNGLDSITERTHAMLQITAQKSSRRSYSKAIIDLDTSTTTNILPIFRGDFVTLLIPD
jgi:hypothetical protein